MHFTSSEMTLLTPNFKRHGYFSTHCRKYSTPFQRDFFENLEPNIIISANKPSKQPTQNPRLSSFVVLV